MSLLVVSFTNYNLSDFDLRLKTVKPNGMEQQDQDSSECSLLTRGSKLHKCWLVIDNTLT